MPFSTSKYGIILLHDDDNQTHVFEQGEKQQQQQQQEQFPPNADKLIHLESDYDPFALQDALVKLSTNSQSHTTDISSLESRLHAVAEKLDSSFANLTSVTGQLYDSSKAGRDSVFHLSEDIRLLKTKMLDKASLEQHATLFNTQLNGMKKRLADVEAACHPETFRNMMEEMMIPHTRRADQIERMIEAQSVITRDLVSKLDTRLDELNNKFSAIFEAQSQRVADLEQRVDGVESRGHDEVNLLRQDLTQRMESQSESFNDKMQEQRRYLEEAFVLQLDEKISANNEAEKARTRKELAQVEEKLDLDFHKLIRDLSSKTNEHIESVMTSIKEEIFISKNEIEAKTDIGLSEIRALIEDSRSELEQLLANANVELKNQVAEIREGQNILFANQQRQKQASPKHSSSSATKPLHPHHNTSHSQANLHATVASSPLQTGTTTTTNTSIVSPSQGQELTAISTNVNNNNFTTSSPPRSTNPQSSSSETVPDNYPNDDFHQRKGTTIYSRPEETNATRIMSPFSHPSSSVTTNNNNNNNTNNNSNNSHTLGVSSPSSGSGQPPPPSIHATMARSTVHRRPLSAASASASANSLSDVLFRFNEDRFQGEVKPNKKQW